jgi:phosphate transport system substrate-binding protein
MNCQRLRFATVVFAVALLGLVTLPPRTAAQNNVQLTGAGSTFVYPIMTHWIADFQQKHPEVRINYQSIGSGGGIQQLKNGLVDFGASDVALSDDQLKQMPGTIVQIPESAGPVCITYNLPNLSKPLRLSGPVLADIFMGTIKTWSDPAIAKTNPGVSLPNRPIAIAHRSDGSGTTGIFTTYLSAISPEWKSKVGQGISVNWPVGLGGKGSEGVTGIVKEMPESIGYVELNYAEENHLPVVEVENQAGQFIAPSSASASAAMVAFRAQLAHDIRLPIVNAPASASKAYPISGLTFLLVPMNGTHVAKREATQEFIAYIVTGGQAIADELHYAALPGAITKIDQSLLAELQANGKTLALK